MKPGDAILDRQGNSICPKCKGPVTEPYKAGNYLVRRHMERLDNGEKCPHGEGEGDPIPKSKR
jgi:hypothetical protein